MLWNHLLDELIPQNAPHKLDSRPIVQAYYAKEQSLPTDVERLSLDRVAKWLRTLGYCSLRIALPKYIDFSSEGSKSLRLRRTTWSATARRESCRDTLLQILPDGSQLQRTPIRADCQAETAAVLALHANMLSDQVSAKIATNLLDYLYFKSELCQRERGDPKHPAFGHIAWGAISPAWRVGNYGDDHARTILATIAASACLDSDRCETPLFQENGDPVSDQLYVSNFILIGFHEAAAATDDVRLCEAENKFIDIVRIQVKSPKLLYLDGTWFRAFDFKRWEFWSSSGDAGWGAWAAEAGWGPAWNGVVLGLRSKQTSLWELTASSQLAIRRTSCESKWRKTMGIRWRFRAKETNNSHLAAGDEQMRQSPLCSEASWVRTSIPLASGAPEPSRGNANRPQNRRTTTALRATLHNRLRIKLTSRQ